MALPKRYGATVQTYSDIRILAALFRWMVKNDYPIPRTKSALVGQALEILYQGVAYGKDGIDFTLASEAREHLEMFGLSGFNTRGRGIKEMEKQQQEELELKISLNASLAGLKKPAEGLSNKGKIKTDEDLDDFMLSMLTPEQRAELQKGSPTKEAPVDNSGPSEE